MKTLTNLELAYNCIVRSSQPISFTLINRVANDLKVNTEDLYNLFF